MKPTRAADVPRDVPPPSAPVLVLGGVVALESGAAVATRLVPAVGVVGTVALRMGFGAVGLVLLVRSRPRITARIARRCLAVAVLLVVHHLCFYRALHVLPLGVAVTLEFLGPLSLALAGSRRPVDLLWAALAGGGVAATAGVVGPGAWGTAGHLDGVAAGLAAGVTWAGYIVLFPRLSAEVGARAGLALSTSLAALAMVPLAVATVGTRVLDPRVVLLGVVVAVLSDVLAYTLQAHALDRIPSGLFSILTSTEPAVGALIGLLFLAQHLDVWQWWGVLAVTAAAVGAVRTHDGPGPALSPSAGGPAGAGGA